MNTYKRYSLPVAQEPTEINRLQFFYIGRQTSNAQKLQAFFDFGYHSTSVESAIFTVKRLLKKQEGVTVPDAIIAEASLGAGALVELHKFIYSHKLLATVPFIVEASGLNTAALAPFKKYEFIDELLFLNEFTAATLQRKVNFLKQMKQQQVQQPQASKVETRFRSYPDVRAIAKRGLDLLISSTLLAVLSPVLLLIALIVKLDTGGPVLYTTLRTGRGHRIYNLYKFNTVIQDAGKKKNGNDRSKWGQFLHKSTLDALPHLLNVWLGNLSLTGVKTLPLHEAAMLTSNGNAQHFLLAAGIWQTHKTDKPALPVTRPLALDADKSDLLYDIWLMANKPSAAIHKTNA